MSSTAFCGRPVHDIIHMAVQEDLHVEFSSGLPYHPDMEQMFYDAPCVRLPHNYFPAPKVPFVLNLASGNGLIRDRSLAHCRKGLEMAARVNAPFYSVHAGFCVDPQPADLGGQFPLREEHPREEYWKRFVDSVTILAAEAHRLQIKCLIENNVVAPRNVSPGGTHTLLCVSHEDIVRLMNDVDSPALGILLDTGHLKVSARSLGFSEDHFLQQVRDYICGIHHSDNNGEGDTNQPLTRSYWFLRYMPVYKNALHILEVHDQTVSQIREQYQLLAEAADVGSEVRGNTGSLSLDT